MSSTSLSSEARTLKGRATPGRATPGRAAGSMQPWQFFLTASFLAAAAAVWLSPPSSPVALLFLSLGIAAAGACAAALFAVLAAIAGRSRAETGVSGSVRETLEREKLLTLRSIKDLEFDGAMGKVSAADAAPLESRLRARAIDIMRQLDGRESVRLQVERDVAARSARDVRPACASCGTANEPDAKFCKSCGAKL